MRITTKYTGNTIKVKAKNIFMDRSVFDNKSNKSRPKTSQSISHNRSSKIEKYKIMKKMLENEKSVSQNFVFT